MRLLAAVALALVLSGCSGDDTPDDVTADQPLGETPSPQTAAPLAAGSPSCEQQVREGQPATSELLANGCSRPDGSTFRFDTTDCKDGRVLTFYGGFHAYVGETWLRGGQGSSEYTAARRGCTG